MPSVFLCSNDDQVLPLWDLMFQNTLQLAMVVVFCHSCRKITNMVVPKEYHLRSQWTPHMCMHTAEPLHGDHTKQNTFERHCQSKNMVALLSKVCTCRFPQLPEFIVQCGSLNWIHTFLFSVGTKHITYSQRTIAEVCCVCVLLCGPGCLWTQSTGALPSRINVMETLSRR